MFNNFHKVFYDVMAEKAIKEKEDLPRDLFSRHVFDIDWIQYEPGILLSTHLVLDHTAPKKERKECPLIEKVWLTNNDLITARQLSMLRLVRMSMGRNPVFVSKHKANYLHDRKTVTTYHIRVHEGYDGIDFDTILFMRQMGYNVTAFQYGMIVVKRTVYKDENKIPLSWNEIVNYNIPLILDSIRSIKDRNEHANR